MPNARKYSFGARSGLKKHQVTSAENTTATSAVVILSSIEWVKGYGDSVARVRSNYLVQEFKYSCRKDKAACGAPPSMAESGR